MLVVLWEFAVHSSADDSPNRGFNGEFHVLTLAAFEAQ